MALSTIRHTITSAAYVPVATGVNFAFLKPVNSASYRIHGGTSLPPVDTEDFVPASGSFSIGDIAETDTVYIRAESSDLELVAMTA